MNINQRLFLDYFNNFLTIGGFASFYGYSDKKAKQIISKGRLIHEQQFGCYLPSELAEKHH